MKKGVLMVAILFLFSLQACAQSLNINISSPNDGDHVSERPIVTGTVSEEQAIVWVIVHPMETSDYWVQPAVTIRRGGIWRVQIYIGRPGNIDVGKHFEIRAVANPINELHEGDVLSNWPTAEAQSEVIEVIRQ